MKRLKEIIEKQKEKRNYKKKYNDTFAQLELVEKENACLKEQIDRLEDKLDKDVKIAQIERLKIINDHANEIKRKLRQEVREKEEKIRELKSKIHSLEN